MFPFFEPFKEENKPLTTDADPAACSHLQLCLAQRARALPSLGAVCVPDMDLQAPLTASLTPPYDKAFAVPVAQAQPLTRGLYMESLYKTVLAVVFFKHVF
ncbi:hypothetical protein FKM82_025344 [Ascaphus truei]